MSNVFEFNPDYPEIFEPMLDYKGRYIILEGGRYSGKSHTVARKLLEDRLYKKRDLICIREHQRTLEQSNYKLLKNIIKKYKLPFRIYASKLISELTGSEIVFEGMNNVTADNIRSFEGFHDAWIEEGQNFSINSFLSLDPTIRQPDSQIFITMNRLVTKGDLIDHLSRVFPGNYLRIYCTYLDNPFLSQNMFDQAEAYRINKPDEYKLIYLGIPDDNASIKIVKNWSNKNIHPVKYSEKLDLHISCDFNIAPNCWILAHKSDNEAFFFDEFCLDMVTEDLIKVVLDKYPHPGRVIVNGDASGDNGHSNCKNTDYMLIRNELIRRGYRLEVDKNQTGKRFKFELRKANGLRKARFTAWNNKVKNIEGEPEIFVDPKCKHLIYNCEELKVIPGTSEYDVPSVVKIKNNPETRFLGHAFDNASYLVNTYWAVKNNYQGIENKPSTTLEQWKRQR